MMAVTGKSFMSNHVHLSPLIFSKQSKKLQSLRILAEKKDFPKKSSIQQNSTPSFSLPYKFLSQSAIAVFSLGFIDAGYSGDWSRIGVISKESEEMLKIASYVVVPLCLFLIFSLSRESEN
ncbi:hypothetical protein Ancab_017824 [Ancistrocladus abbreviatus]